MSNHQDVLELLPVKAHARSGPGRRLAFIDFRLQWEGRINRSDLTQFFGISVPQASIDLARYTEQAPQNLVYDRRSKAYLSTEEFQSISAESQPKRYLDELLAYETGLLKNSAGFIGWRPPIGFTPPPGRTVESGTLAALLKAIKAGSSLNILYQSMSRLEPTERIISPHALGNDGFRWHARAFCHVRKEYRDFVLGRILKVQEAETPSVLTDDDTQWHTILSLVLAPNPDLSEAKRHAIELDYGMEGGELSLTCRQALLYYTLRQLRLDNERSSPPERQQIVLKNREELAPFL